MSSEREAILGRVKAALAPLSERAAHPDFDKDLAVVRKVLDGKELAQAFSERLKAVNGKAFTSVEALVEQLKASGWSHGYCDPELMPELSAGLSGLTVETTFDRSRIDDYQFGITRAAGAIAESGTIILKDESTSRRLAALAPWVHVAVFSKSQILSDISQAVKVFGADPNVIWCTGPSKTADVEGILIEGVHGPGQQYALMLD